MELDIYLPELQIAFEYQGEQHYFPSYWNSNPNFQKKKDEEKYLACKQVCF